MTDTGGFIYAIKDPRLTEKQTQEGIAPEDCKDIIFCSSSYRPWEAVERQLRDSVNPDLKAWARGLFEAYPSGLFIRGEEVVDGWMVAHGTPDDSARENTPELPPVPTGQTLLEWVILDYEAYPEPGATRWMTKRKIWIAKLLEQGQPLLNRPAGRPRLVKEA